MDYVSVYDQSGAMLAVLDNADGIGYELKHNDLWTGSFSLPAGDEKNEFCRRTTWCACRMGRGKRGFSASSPCPAAT